MSALWNQAALHWRNYQTPKPRVMHGPVGKSRGLLCDEAGLPEVHMLRCDWADMTCARCGFLLCDCRNRCAAQPTAAELPKSGSANWALEMMRAGKTVRRIASGTTFQIAKDGVGFRYRIAHSVLDVENPSTTNFLHVWSECLFEIVEEP
jgi:hypothetical protein